MVTTMGSHIEIIKHDQLGMIDCVVNQMVFTIGFVMHV